MTARLGVSSAIVQPTASSLQDLVAAIAPLLQHSSRPAVQRSISPSLPTPAQLFRQFDQGRITRSEFQAAMRLHQLLLIDDIHDAMRDPGLSWFDEVLNRRAARRLIQQHGEDIIRETLAALAELPDFPPAIHIWNASHRLVPLYCFIRTKRAPIFRIAKLQAAPQTVAVSVEYTRGRKSGLIREDISLRRNRHGQLIAIRS